MKKTIYILLLFIVATCWLSCKKKKDSIINQTINGQVFNLCTDSGLANCEVFLYINTPDGSSKCSDISDSNGNFSFSNVEIHSNDDYSYTLEVPTNGAGGYKPAINGSTIDIDKGNPSKCQIMNVAPSMNGCNLFFPSGTNISAGDTVLLTIQQKVLHKNLPSWNYQLTVVDCPKYNPPTTNFIGSTGSYWMGKWYSTLDKTINGVHVIKVDSFYVGWGQVATDTIPW